ncbi:MAG: dihydrodipicolinate synthase family protein [Acidobacteria bacterium]|nr:dihydrodipicolinate synthase family protein [Acidobacteriota bacterium]
MRRREFLKLSGPLLVAGRAGADVRKRLEGVFPILQTPFTEEDRLDLAVLEREAQFLERTGVQGMVWPQLASEYATLSMEERFAGAEALVRAGRRLRPAIVIGVQGRDAGEARKFARHAAKLGPDAIIALPPQGATNHEQIAAYYAAIGRECGLPLFVQTVGEMSVGFVIEMARAVPSLRYVKDEAGRTLPRISEYRATAKDLIAGVFTGGHGRTFLDELARGSSGTMPACGFADLYAQTWDLWRAGKREEAFERFGKAAVLIHQVQAYGLPALKYLLQLRGVFRNVRCRQKGEPLDDAARRSLEESLKLAGKYLHA